MFPLVVETDAIMRGVNKAHSINSVTIRISTINGRNSIVGRIGLGFSGTFGISVVGSAGNGLVGSVDTGGRFAQTVVNVGIVIPVVPGVDKSWVSLGFWLGQSGSNNDKQDLQKEYFFWNFYLIWNNFTYKGLHV